MGFEGPTYVGYRGVTADGGHVSFVEVVEFGARFAGHILGYHLGGVTAHLHGGLGDPGDLAASLFYVRQVSADEYFLMAWRIQVEIDHNAAALVSWSAQHLAQRRSLNAGRP